MLYLALAPEVAIGERQRHLTIERLARLNDYRLTTLELRLGAVVDCTDLGRLGVTIEQLCDDTDYEIGQRLAEAVRNQEMQAEGMIVPSATRLGNNLVVFPDRLHQTSEIQVVSHVDPRLFVDRA